MRNFGVGDQNPDPQDIIGGGGSGQPPDGGDIGAIIGCIIGVIVVIIILINVFNQGGCVPR